MKAIVDDESSGRISQQQRMYAFDQLKKEGIQQKNRCIIGGNGDDLHCERRSEGTKVMCSSCKGFYKKVMACIANVMAQGRTRVMCSSCNGFYKKVMVCIANVIARGELGSCGPRAMVSIRR